MASHPKIRQGSTAPLDVASRKKKPPERQLGRTAQAVLERLNEQAVRHNAVVVSQRTLAGLVGCTVRTVQTALAELETGHWIQVIKLNATGTVCAYVVRTPAGWPQDGAAGAQVVNLSAAVVVAMAEQAKATRTTTPLRKLSRRSQKPRKSPSPAEAKTHRPRDKAGEDAEYCQKLESLGQLRLDQE